MKSRIASGVLAVVIGATFTVASAGAASAAPTCTTTTRAYRVDNLIYANLPATSSGSTNCELSQGNQSLAVRALQNTLRYCYGKNLTLDGIFGPATTSALVDVQGQENIGADGAYGRITRDAIKHKFHWTSDGTYVDCWRLSEI